MKLSRMKKTLAATLVLSLLLTAAAYAATITLAYEDGSLFLRSGPGRNYKARTTVHDGDYVSIISYGDVWTKVRTDEGTTGYVKNLYIDNGDFDYAAGTDYFDHYTVYATASVNLRSGASTDTAIITTLHKGDKLKALGENGDFYLVETQDGTQGFASERYISRKKPAGTSSSTPSYKTKTVTGSYVNMREGGGLSYDVVRVLSYGTEVTVLKTGNYWTQVQYRNSIGWIKNTYLE